jgi:glycosyltransferase involved in cell wall biosynthesis
MTGRRLRLLTLLTYYTPHISGLTLYGRHINAGLVRRGHSMTVLTSRYDPDLPATEQIDGSTVERSHVWLRVSKGVLMPGYLKRAWQLIRRSDAILLHVPQIESALLVIMARLQRKPVLATYHCDLELPDGIARVVFTPFIKLSHLLAVLLANRVTASSDDYVNGSRFLRVFKRKIEICYPPCVRLTPDPSVPLPLDIEDGQPLIGFVGRFAEEKGVDYIIDAVPAVLREHPNAVFAFVGERE